MMLRALFLLTPFILGTISALGNDRSLFSLEAAFCGRRNNTRSCSKKVGDGYCIDENVNLYPLCFANNAVTLEECQKMATDEVNAVGMEYDPVAQDCNILFDAGKSKKCPNGFTTAFDDIGTGTIMGSDYEELTKNFECFACTLE